MDHRFAILIDGGFFLRKLQSKVKSTPTIQQVVSEIDLLKSNKMFEGYELLRTYYYDAYPATGKITHPLTREELNLAETAVFTRNKSLLQKLELLPDVSLRAGELSPRGYKLKSQAMSEGLADRKLQDTDFIPDIEQKGVDLRIGLDIARLSLRGLVQTIVVVTGDSDFIPAFKFARREGVRVILGHMGHGVKRDLKAHTDGIIE